MGELLANYLKNGRKQKKIPQYKLADKIGISRSYLIFIEGGEREPSSDKLRSLVNELNLDFNKAVEFQTADIKLKKLGISGPSNIKEPVFEEEINNQIQEPTYQLKHPEKHLLNVTLDRYLTQLGWLSNISEDGYFLYCNSGTNWHIRTYPILEREDSQSMILSTLFGELSLKITFLEDKYSIATMDRELYLLLLSNTPKIFIDTLNLSYILIEDDSITIKDIKNSTN
ncbi:MAG: helix-turn-helix transcriptional regulator [Clostridium sp.]